MSKSDEKDWSEIFEEARSKAKGDLDTLMTDIRPKFEKFIEKAHKANFHAVADDMLEAVENMTSELRKKVNSSAPEKPKSKPAKRSKKQKKPVYILEDGTYIYRMTAGVKSKHKLTDAQIKKAKDKAAHSKP